MLNSKWRWLIVAFVLLWVIAISGITIYKNFSSEPVVEPSQDQVIPRVPTTGNLDWPCPPNKEDCKG